MYCIFTQMHLSNFLSDHRSFSIYNLQCLPVFSFSAGSSPTDTKKSASELQHEQEILSEIMRTVEERDQLVSVLEEQRLKERAEDKDLEGLLLSKGYEFHWAPADDSYWPEKLE